MPGERPTQRARMIAVVVLYRQLPSASVTVATLTRALKQNSSADCTVLLYDNSPDPGPEDNSPDVGPGDNRSAEEALRRSLPDGFRYQAATANRGLLGAYEAALAMARAEGYDWLLTLDQDTALPEDFFPAIQPGLAAAAEDLRIAAVVPHLAEGETLLSPAYVGLTRTTPMPASFAGIPDRESRAFNSAALLRVQAIEAIGGFHPCFWLDHLDSWLHHELFLHGWRMYVLGSVRLEHHFSLLNYKERVTLDHFRNFLLAEGAYFDLYGSWLARAAYTAQLGVRLVNQRRRGEAPEIRRATRAAGLRRLTASRSKRLKEWREASGCAQDGSSGGRAESRSRE